MASSAQSMHMLTTIIACLLYGETMVWCHALWWCLEVFGNVFEC